jgi:transketolase
MMHITTSKATELAELCRLLRAELIDILHQKQTGHPGGSLSCCEILATLYFHHMNVDPQNPARPDRDRLVLSKGHAAPMLYLCLAHRGFFPVGDIQTLRQLDSHLQGHPCAHKTPGVELSTGPLGLGLSAGNGMAEAAKLQNLGYKVYVILGDGELQEGCVWEAAMTAAKFGTNNIVAILDHNGVQLDGTNEEIMPLGDVEEKFAAFGWHVIHADGHNVVDVNRALNEADDWKGGPAIIIAKTVKGKGVSFMEGKNIWHGAPIGDADYAAAKKELGGAGA